MNVREILTELARLRISLQVEGDALKVRGERGALTDSLRQEMIARKPDILAFLRQPESRPDQDAIQPVPRTGPMALSVPQDWMWYWEQVDPRNSFLHLPFFTRVVGALRIELLQKAIVDVVRRHETLRSTFADDGSGPRVHIHAHTPAPVEVPVIDLRHLPQAGREPEAQRLITVFLEQPFDVRRGPLFRFVLVRMAADEHWLVGAFHHLISDMASTFLVQLELFSLYDAHVTGRAAELPELPIQYADYGFWQRQVLVGEVRERLMRYWRQRLAGVPSVVLPADRPRPKIPSRRGNTALFKFPADTVVAVQAFCHARRVSLFRLAVAAVSTLLHRCSGQTDVLLGCSINGRTSPELAPLLGNLGWDLGLRNDLTGDPTFGEFVERVARVVSEAMEYQELPVAEAFRDISQGSRNTFDPFFKVMLTLLSQPGSISATGLDIEPLAIWPPRGTLYYDLFLGWAMIGKELYLTVEYAEDLFERETIERIYQALAGILETGVRDPGLRLSELAIDEHLRANARALNAPPMLLTVSATFTAEPLAGGLEFWSNELGWPWQVSYAGFGQVFQQLLDPESMLSRNQNGVNAVLVRLADLAPAGDRDALDAAVEQLIAAVAAARAAVVLVLCPSPGEGWTEREATLGTALNGAPGVYVTTSAEIAELYPIADIHDPEADLQGCIPYSPAYYAVLATLLARRAYSLKSHLRKVIVLDCDNTLWDGVCAEVGPDGVELNHGHQALHAFLTAQHDRGTILCLCSKNEEVDVRAVFTARTDMPLRLEHIAAMRVNWRPKSENLRGLARELNMGLDTFVFIDDNPIECAEVLAKCPEVVVVQAPRSADGLAAILSHLWALDRMVVTAEDRQRTGFYQREADRARLRADAPSLADFLELLAVQVDIAALEDAQVSRVAQLMHRTNQFNTTTLRLSEAQIAAFGKDRCLVTAVRDRFGDHGLVGVTLLSETEETLRVENLLLSCRTLGRGVEHQMLSAVGQRAKAAGKRWVEVPVVPSARNRPVRDFLDAVAREVPGSLFSDGLLRLDTAALAALRFDPGRAAEPAKYETEEVPSSGPVRHPPGEVDPEKLLHIARTLSVTDDLVAAVMRRPRSHLPADRAPFVAPRTPAEQAMVEIWSALLGADSIGIKDDFFALGGDSVSAIQMIGRARAAGLVLSASDLYLHRNIEELASLSAEPRMEVLS